MAHGAQAFGACSQYTLDLSLGFVTQQSTTCTEDARHCLYGGLHLCQRQGAQLDELEKIQKGIAIQAIRFQRLIASRSEDTVAAIFTV